MPLALVACGVALALGATVLGPVLAGLLLLAPFAVRRPPVCLVLLVVVEVTNLAALLGNRVPGRLFWPVALLGVAAVALALRDPVTRARVCRPLALVGALLGAYLGTQAVAVLAAQRPDLAYAVLGPIVVDTAYIALVAALALISARPWALALAITVPLVALCVLAVVNQVGFGGTVDFGGLATVTSATGELATTPRQSGPLLDSNFWGRHLVIAVPLALALLARAARSGSWRRTAAWALSIAALLAGMYLTQSRGTFIAAAYACAIWALLSGPDIRRWCLRLLPALLPLGLVPGIGNRLVALVGDVRGNAAYGLDWSVLVRRAAQEIALAMFRDQPLLGVGPGGYVALLDAYAGKVPSAVLIPVDAAHNLYLQLAAESGLVGLAGWLVMFTGFTALAWGAVRRHARTGSSAAERQLAAAVLASLLGWAVASVFLHLAHYRTLGTLLALAACVAAVPGTAVPGTAVPGVQRAARRPVAAGIIALAALAAALGTVAATSTTSYTASRTVTLVPPGLVDGTYLRELRVRDRTEMLPTYAALIATAGTGGSADADPTRGVITVSTSAPSPAQARAELADLLAGAVDRLATTGANRDFLLRQVGVDTDTVRHGVSPGGIGLGALAAAGVGLFGVLRRRRRGSSRAAPPDTVALVEFSPSGGLFQFAVQLGESLAADGHRVEVLTGPDPELAARHPNLRIRSVLPTWHPTSDRWGPAAVRRPVRATQLVAAWLVLTWHLARRPPRAVLFSNWRFSFEPLFVVWITRMLRGRSLVGIVAHEPLPRSDHRDTATPKSGRLLGWAFGAAWRRLDVVFALGTRSAALIRERWDPPCEPVVIPHGDERALRGGHPVPPVTTTAPVALFFGTWTRYKGLDVLLDAFERVRAALPGARLVLAGVVGADLDPAAVITRARAIGGIDARPGYLDISEVSALVGSARLLVTPYVRASQSGVVHLAYTFGRPVVSSAVGDIPEVVHDRVNGLLVPPRDARRLAEAMVELLGDPELAARLGATGASELEAAWQVAATRVGAALDAAGTRVAGPGSP